MPRLRLVLICTLVLVPVAPSTAHAAHAETVLIQKVNSFRAAHGLGALRPSPSLSRSSKRFARYQMRRDRFGHAARIWAARKFSPVGEALAFRFGWKPRTSAVLRQWRGSPPHRALILSRSFRYIGIGRAKGRFRGRRASIWVLQVGR